MSKSIKKAFSFRHLFFYFMFIILIHLSSSTDSWITNNQYAFNEGSYNQTFYNTTGNFVQLNLTYTTGNYISKIFDAGGATQWNNISWVQGGYYQQELPDNKAIENGLDGADMTGNVLLLHLNEGSGIITYDSSENGNNGTLENGATWVDGKFSKALSFNSSNNNYLKVNNSLSLNISNSITVATWIKPLDNSWKYKKAIYITPATSENDYQIKILLNSSNFNYSHANSNGSDLRFYQTDGTKLNYWIEKWNTSGTSIVWVKVKDVGTNKVYMYYGNPSANSESNGNATFLFFDNMETWQGWTQHGSGVVSQSSARAYEGSYSAAKKSNCDPNGAYKALPYPLGRDIILEAWVNRYSGSSGSCIWDRIGLIDESGNGYGSAYSPVSNSNNAGIDVRNSYNGAINKFNGPKIGGDNWYKHKLIIMSNGSIKVEFYNESEDLIASRSISNNLYSNFKNFYIFGGHDFWVDLVIIRKYSNPEPTITVGNETVVGISKADSYGIGANTTTAFASINNHTILALNSINPGWNFIALTYDGSNQKLYVNGKQKASQSLSETISTNSNDLLIGDLFNGIIDEVSIWNRSLSKEEIENIHKRGILKLNLSVRSCDDPVCSGDSWINLGNKPSQNLSSNGVLDNRYFQYKFGFETENNNYTPELYNVTVNYTILNFAPTVILNSPLNNSFINNNYTILNISIYDNDSDNITVWFYGDDNLLTTLYNQTSGIVVYNWSNLFEGLHNWSVIVGDEADNSTSDTYYFTVDLTNPKISFVSPTTSNGSYSKNYIEANISANDTNLDIIIIYLYNLTSLITSISSTVSPFFYNFSGLPDGSYYLNASVNDTAGNTNITETRFIVLDTSPPIITNVKNISITTNSVIITWDTDENANSTINYGDTSLLGTIISNSSYTKNHSIQLTGLNSNTVYYYNITSCDSLYHCNTKGPYNFTTSKTLSHNGNNKKRMNLRYVFNCSTGKLIVLFTHENNGVSQVRTILKQIDVNPLRVLVNYSNSEGETIFTITKNGTYKLIGTKQGYYEAEKDRITLKLCKNQEENQTFIENETINSSEENISTNLSSSKNITNNQSLEDNIISNIKSNITTNLSEQFEQDINKNNTRKNETILNQNKTTMPVLIFLELKKLTLMLYIGIGILILLLSIFIMLVLIFLELKKLNKKLKNF